MVRLLPEFNVVLPVSFKTPGAPPPGASAPPLATVTGLAMVPVPPSVAPELTVTALPLERLPLMYKPPALTRVAPV
jgi:hypothetical protein